MTPGETRMASRSENDDPAVIANCWARAISYLP